MRALFLCGRHKRPAMLVTVRAERELPRNDNPFTVRAEARTIGTGVMSALVVLEMALRAILSNNKKWRLSLVFAYQILR